MSDDSHSQDTTSTGAGQGGESVRETVETSTNQDTINQRSVEDLFEALVLRTKEERSSATGSADGAPDIRSRGAPGVSRPLGHSAAAQLDAGVLFRHEAAISQMDLRLEIARHVDRYVEGDERVALDERFLHAWGDLAFTSGSRSRTVEGDYTRKTDNADVFVVSHDSYTEEVHGGVSLDMSLESEAIMGGGYIGTMLGPFMKICGWSDFLAWGGWGEADAVRAEIGNTMIRSMMNFAHTAGFRGLAAYTYFDDFTLRVENIGVLNDSQTAILHAGTPGSGVASDM